MNTTAQHIIRWLVLLITLLMYAGAAIFLVLRMSHPSDGTRLWIHPQTIVSSPVSALPLNSEISDLRASDKVIAIDGKPITYWADMFFQFNSSSPIWDFGRQVTYTVERNDQRLDIPIILRPYPLSLILRENLLTVLFLIAVQLASGWLFTRRPDERAAQTLLLASSGLAAFSICWFLGTDLVLFVSASLILIYYRVLTFILLMVMCAALLHFTLLLPRLQSEEALKQPIVSLIYIIPYPLYAVFLILSYTTDTLEWIRLWEQGIWVVMIACLVTGLVLAGIKYRNLRNVLARRRLVTVVAAFIVTAFFAIMVGWLPLSIASETGSNWEVIPLVTLPIALSLVLAVLFYRLFDIRIAIQRALVWSALTAIIVIVYITVVGTLSILFNQRNDPILALVATGVVAVLFHPVRERLQRVVNKLVYGERDTPYKVIIGLTKRLEGTLVPQVALNMIVETLGEALKLPYTAIELVENDHFIMVAEHGSRANLPDNECVTVPLKYAEGTLGRLLISRHLTGEGLSFQDHRLISGLVHEAEVTIQTTRLTVDLQRSREKIIVAREEERRHLRRDLHDGLGPSLASLMLQVDATRNLLHSDIPRAEAILLELKTQIQNAIADVRRIVYELRPPVLDELGLIAALEEKTRQLGQSAELIIKLDAPRLPPLPAAVEGALYRIALEALTNTIRHAQATECTIRIEMNGELRLEVVDNGKGLPDKMQHGIGIHSMQERAAELGGRCVVEKLAQGGTRMLATFPMRSFVVPQMESKG